MFRRLATVVGVLVLQAISAEAASYRLCINELGAAFDMARTAVDAPLNISEFAQNAETDQKHSIESSALRAARVKLREDTSLAWVRYITALSEYCDMQRGRIILDVHPGLDSQVEVEMRKATVAREKRALEELSSQVEEINSRHNSQD